MELIDLTERRKKLDQALKTLSEPTPDSLIEYATKGQIGVDPSNPGPDPVTIKVLESALEKAMKGEITGVVMLAWEPANKGFAHWNALPCHEPDTESAAFRFLGGLNLIKRDLKFLAMEHYPSLESVVCRIESGEMQIDPNTSLNSPDLP